MLNNSHGYPCVYWILNELLFLTSHLESIHQQHFAVTETSQTGNSRRVESETASFQAQFAAAKDNGVALLLFHLLFNSEVTPYLEGKTGLEAGSKSLKSARCPGTYSTHLDANRNNLQ